MDKEIKPGVFEVENPVYMEYEDMRRKYPDKLVVVSNIVYGEHFSAAGGIARYYGERNSDVLNMWGELGKLSQNGIVSFFNFLVPHVYETGGITL